jgi:hypothetical protein
LHESKQQAFRATASAGGSQVHMAIADFPRT